METENNKSTSDTREALTQDVSNLRRDAENLKQDALQIAQDVKDHATAHVDATKKKFNDTVEEVKKFFSARPWAVLGLGFVLGYHCGRKRRRSRRN